MREGVVVWATGWWYGGRGCSMGDGLIRHRSPVWAWDCDRDRNRHVISHHMDMHMHIHMHMHMFSSCIARQI